MGTVLDITQPPATRSVGLEPIFYSDCSPQHILIIAGVPIEQTWYAGHAEVHIVVVRLHDPSCRQGICYNKHSAYIVTTILWHGYDTTGSPVDVVREGSKVPGTHRWRGPDICTWRRWSFGAPGSIFLFCIGWYVNESVQFSQDVVAGFSSSVMK